MRGFWEEDEWASCWWGYNPGVLKRLLRIVLGVGLVLSLMLCAGVGWMWRRSSSTVDEITSSRMTIEKIAKGYSQISLRKVTLMSAGGRIEVRWERYWMPMADATVIELQRTTDRFCPHNWDLEHRKWPNRSMRGPMLGSRFGFSWYREEELRPKDPVRVSLVFPHWLALLVFGLAPAMMAVQIVRRRRRAGMCPVCGYDLRASLGRCPECGAVKGLAYKSEVNVSH